MHWTSLLVQSAVPTAYEQALLTRYARGQAAREPLQHVLYCSQATEPFDERRLTELLEQSRAYNQQKGITGLLCYKAGYFVQFVEGPPAALTELFVRIERDPRHQQVQVLSAGMSPLRQFTDWRLAVAGPHPAEFYWLITYHEAHHHRLVLPQIPVHEPELVAMLEVFSNAYAKSVAPDTAGLDGGVVPNPPPPASRNNPPPAYHRKPSAAANSNGQAH